ncbi:methyl-accepting chemotaxis protein [uncultured Aquitalea sp.]|uniref:methyl-accepting chemotaxis protein n=2 Tax=uncultured Aquitalea sp. TaxID=540272 RepID=UPI0025CC56CB|nr:methyl-accepting chemotaxis protein [uncultured Aquitalea sp.]
MTDLNFIGAQIMGGDNMLGQLTVRQKLLGGFAVIIALLVVLLSAALHNMGTINEKLLDITQDRYPKVKLTHGITEKSLDIGRQLRSAALFPATSADFLSKVDGLSAGQKDDMDKIEALLSTAKGKALFAELKEKRGAFIAAVSDASVLLKAQKAAEAADVIKNRVAPANNAFMASLKSFSDFQEELMGHANEAAATAYHDAVTSMMTIAVIALLLAVATALLIARLITTPLQKSAALVENIRRGDLSGRDDAIPPSRDEALQIARSIQEMRSGLREIVQAIQQNAHNVADSARELSSMAEHVANGAQQQAEATSEAAATIEELTVSINHVADNSTEASEQAKNTGTLARDGGKEVIHSVSQIREVSHSVGGTAHQMNELSQEVQRIGSIVTVIRDVADQTNLLALNAAIEAARAGEMGRGFAVVADEVRKLAERTTASALEITQMINAIQQGVGKVVGSMERSLSSVDSVSSSTELASQTIERISHSTHAIVSAVANITDSLGEQRIASQSLAMNMEKVSQMAEENSATVEELATTSAQLSALSGNLQEITARFHL